jgi:hypothetical protein
MVSWLKASWREAGPGIELAEPRSSACPPPLACVRLRIDQHSIEVAKSAAPGLPFRTYTTAAIVFACRKT